MMKKKIDTIKYPNIGVKVDIFYFQDYRHQFFYILHNGDVSVRSHCYPTKNICLEQLKQAINTLWNA